MAPLQWLLFVAGAAAAIVYSVWWVRTREEHVAGRGWVAALRAGALVLAWLILMNPKLPARAEAGRGGEVAVLLDGSLSMSRARSTGTTAWDEALDSLDRFETVYLFGAPVPRRLAVDSLPAGPPFAETWLAPAVRAAAAAGYRRATVFTDGAVADQAESLEEAQRRGLLLSVVPLGEPAPGLAIAEVRAPRWAVAGDSAMIEVEVVAAGVAADSLRIEIADEDGQVRSAGWVPMPASGRYASLRLSLPIAEPAGFQRYVVRTAEPALDAERRDEARALYIRVSEESRGPTLISLRPDWEPSFLAPNLERASDAPLSTYLNLAGELVNLEGYRPITRARAVRQARRAPLLIVHGYGAEAPEWAGELVRRAERILVLPAGARGFELPGWGIEVGPAATGEWYATEFPASPLELEVGVAPLEDLPPLWNARTVEARAAWTPLSLQRGRRGEARPAVVAGRSGRRRWAVAAAEGYWRWALRGDEGRQLYRALWTGVAGWLLGDRPSGAAGLDPLAHTVARGEPLRWRVTESQDSLSVELLSGEARSVGRSVALAGDSLGFSLPPGRYRYHVRAYREGVAAATAEGPVEVEEYTPELLPFLGSALEDAVRIAESPAPERHGGARGLATLGWPYLLLIALFCAEWGTRRWIGLR